LAGHSRLLKGEGQHDMKGKLRAFVFDMDGVLINSHSAHRKAWREFLRGEGVEVSDDELVFILEGRTRSEILRRFLGDIPASELQKCGHRKDDFFRCLEHQIEPVSGVLQFLERLIQRGLSLAVATSASEIRTFATIERLGLGGFFDAVVTASDVEQGKPDPGVYRLACERLQVSPQFAMAFDDARAGVQAAKSAGMRCIGVASNGLCEQLLLAGVEAVVPSFACPQFDELAKTLLKDERPEKTGAIYKIMQSDSEGSKILR
jgi:HAD superfamily hydrolase (TIGR01509 family)